MEQYLVFIESNTSGTGRLFARAARRHGLRPILMTDNPARYPYLKEDAIEALQLNTQDEQAMLDACRQLACDAVISGITSSSEYFIGTAAALARRLELPGPDPHALQECRDKYRQRVVLREAGVAVPSFMQAVCVEEALEAARTLSLPVIVKPVSGSGSFGVKLCRELKEVATHAEALLSQERNERGMLVPRRILIEALAKGPEYSVETFGSTVIGITEKHLGLLPYFVEIGHDFPASLPAKTESAIHQIALQALAALKLTWGPAHIELRLTTVGPKIIEVNPRLAGGYIPELVRLAYGIDLIDDTIKLAARLKPALTKQAARCASLRFLIPEEGGVFRDASGLDAARREPEVVEARIYLQPGDSVQRRGDFRDRVGHVLACDESAQAARSAVERASRAIRLHVEPMRP